jgi:uncharacterized protein (DUF1697 family)
VTRYALLLRGVNVGGHRKLPMPALRAALEGAGYADVATYLQSGNAVVFAKGTTAAKVAARTEQALAADCGVATRVLVRTHPDLAAIVAANPFPDAVAEPAKLHVVFLSAQPSAAGAEAVDAAALAPDEFALGDHAIYLRYAVSAGRSKLAEVVGKAVVAGRKDVVATARNWNTVLALTRMTEG